MEDNAGRQRKIWKCCPCSIGCGGVLLVFIWIVILGGGPDGNGLGQRRYKRASCLNNLRQCGSALNQYTQDFDGWLPSSAVVSHSDKWNKADFEHFAKLNGEETSDATQTTWIQLLGYQMRKDDIICPDDWEGRDASYIWDDQSGHRNPKAPVSYWWKLAIDKAWYGIGCTKRYQRLDDYPSNKDFVVLYEHKPWHYQDRICWNNVDPKVGLINGVKINVLFMDGHADIVKIRNATSADPRDCVSASDGEPMYFNFDNTKPASGSNPPSEKTPARYTDPAKFSDKF